MSIDIILLHSFYIKSVLLHITLCKQKCIFKFNARKVTSNSLSIVTYVISDLSAQAKAFQIEYAIIGQVIYMTCNDPVL